MESASSSSEASLRDSITEFRAADRLPREALYERARTEVGACKKCLRQRACGKSNGRLRVNLWCRWVNDMISAELTWEPTSSS